MHCNTQCQDRIEKFSGEGHSPSPDPFPLEREKPLPKPHPTPSAPRSSRLRRSTPHAFGARFYASRIFSADCLATLPVTNEVNGENLQDPPIKNPGYANAVSKLLTSFHNDLRLIIKISYYRKTFLLRHLKCYHRCRNVTQHYNS